MVFHLHYYFFFLLLIRNLRAFNVADIKCRYYSKICEIAYRMTRYFFMCRIQQSIVWHTVLQPRWVNNLFTTIFNITTLLREQIFNTIILLIEQGLEQIEITCSNKKKVIYINKTSNLVGVNIIEDVKMVKVIL